MAGCWMYFEFKTDRICWTFTYDLRDDSYQGCHPRFPPSGRKELPFTKVGKASEGQNIGNSVVDKLTFEMHIKYPTDVD